MARAKKEVPAFKQDACPVCQAAISKTPRGRTGTIDCPNCGAALWVHKPFRGVRCLVNMAYLAEGREFQDEVDGFRAGDEIRVLSGFNEGHTMTVAPSTGRLRRVWIACYGNGLYFLYRVRTKTIEPVSPRKKAGKKPEKKLSDSERLALIMRKKSFTEADVQELARLRSGRCLLGFPGGSTIAPGALRHLSRARQWKMLDFEDVILRPANFEDIGTLQHIVRLQFRNCPIGNAGLKRLGAMPKLTDLWLNDTKVTNAGLAHLAQFPTLQWLQLCNTNISDAGLKHLTGLSHIRDLWLSETKVTDKGLANLTGLSSLSILALDHTGVTNEGIGLLACLPKLRFGMDLVSTTKVTKKGLEEFFVAQQEAKREAKRKKAAAKRAVRTFDKPNPQDVDAAKEALFAFFDAMTAWETKCKPKDTRRASQLQQKALKDIFAKHCTKKKRAYGRPNVFAWQSPPTYGGYQKVKILDIEQPTPRKLAFSTAKWRSFRYQFVMVKRGDSWLVDHKKIFLDGWEPEGL